MDISTLNAVIKELQAEVDHCKEMIRWSVKEDQGDDTLNMWCNSKVQAQHSLDIVKVMLDEELDARAQEAA